MLRSSQAPKRDWWRPISALDFAYVSANNRPEPKFDEHVSQLATRIQMRKPCEILYYSPNFHETLLARLVFILTSFSISYL